MVLLEYIMARHRHNKNHVGAIILTIVLIVAVIVAAYYALSYYNVLGYKSIKNQNSTTPITTVASTIPTTSTQSTTIPTTACSAGYPYDQIYVGNSINCGLFQLQLLNVTTNGTSNRAIINLYYEGKLFVNQSAIGVGNETHFSVFGTTLYVFVGGASVSPPYADIGLSINSHIISVTVATTTSETTASTTTTAISSSTSSVPSTSTIIQANTTSTTTSINATTSSSTTTTTIPASQNQTYANSTFIEIPNSNQRGSRFTYVPIATSNTTVIEFICQYFPAGYENPGYGTASRNFSSIYTLQGQTQTADYGESLHESTATFQMYDYGVTCN